MGAAQAVGAPDAVFTRGRHRVLAGGLLPPELAFTATATRLRLRPPGSGFNFLLCARAAIGAAAP